MTSRRRRSLGQHFLNSRRIARRIVDIAGIAGETILEIGAGKGMLTKMLAEKARQVYAVEIDNRLVRKLAQLESPNIKVVPVDFLSLDISAYGQPVVIGNIPYSISRLIIERIIAQRGSIKRAVLMVQKEFGERLYAVPGISAYGPTAVQMTYYFVVDKEFTVPARFFSPSPKVSSIVISIRKKKVPFAIPDEKVFFDFVKKVFQYRRKILRNCLENMFPKGIRDLNKDLLVKRPSELEIKDLYHVYSTLTGT